MKRASHEKQERRMYAIARVYLASPRFRRRCQNYFRTATKGAECMTGPQVGQVIHHKVLMQRTDEGQPVEG